MKNKYKLGDIVYLTTDPEQKVRLIIGVLERQNACTYELAHSDTCSWHTEIEINDDRDILKLFK